MESLLKTLRYNFINEALDFVGVHQERILQVNSRSTYAQLIQEGLAAASSAYDMFSSAVSQRRAHGAEPGMFR